MWRQLLALLAVELLFREDVAIQNKEISDSILKNAPEKSKITTLLFQKLLSKNDNCLWNKKTCGSVRNALKVFKDNNIEVEFFDFKQKTQKNQK